MAPRGAIAQGGRAWLAPRRQVGGARGVSASSARIREILCVACVCASLCGCGVDEGSPPVISNILYSPSWALVGFGNGTLTMVGTVDYVDPDSDLAYIRAATQACGKGQWRYFDRILSAAAAGESGSLQFVSLVSTNCPQGTYSVRVSVFDGAGHQSNELDAPVTLTEQ
jgi:hypothetical protein